MTETDLTEAEKFFYDNAGISYQPDVETEEQGRIRCARELANAEKLLRAGPYYVDITPDPEPWGGELDYDGPLWEVTLYRVDDRTEPEVVGSLSSVGCEDGAPYLRVVAAELALEYLGGGKEEV